MNIAVHIKMKGILFGRKWSDKQEILLMVIVICPNEFFMCLVVLLAHITKKLKTQKRGIYSTGPRKKSSRRRPENVMLSKQGFEKEFKETFKEKCFVLVFRVKLLSLILKPILLFPQTDFASLELYFIASMTHGAGDRKCSAFKIN